MPCMKLGKITGPVSSLRREGSLGEEHGKFERLLHLSVQSVRAVSCVGCHKEIDTGLQTQLMCFDLQSGKMKCSRRCIAYPWEAGVLLPSAVQRCVVSSVEVGTRLQ